MSIALMVCLCWSLAGSEPPVKPSPVPGQVGSAEVLAPIRTFELDTLARLGRDLYRHDQMAWQATDLVAEQIGLEKLQAEGAQGWVVDESSAIPVVRFLRRQGGLLEAACDVEFPLLGKPRLVIPKDRTITLRQAAHSLARTTAIRRLTDGGYPLCPVQNGSYNFVVLDDPAGNGLLFYLLRPKETMNSIPVGGHYRLCLTADGRSVTRVDRLSASCLTLERPPERNAEALWMTHLASSTPIETHVFLSLQENLPFFVGTPDKRMWRVSQGTIQAIGSPDAPPASVPASGTGAAKP